jgi:hypothetical protein
VGPTLFFLFFFLFFLSLSLSVHPRGQRLAARGPLQRFTVPLSSTLDFHISCSERDDEDWDGVSRCRSFTCVFAIAGVLPLSGADSLNRQHPGSMVTRRGHMHARSDIDAYGRKDGCRA